jgi:hypothetical protein
MRLEVCKEFSEETIENLEDYAVEPSIRLTPEFVEEEVKP